MKTLAMRVLDGQGVPYRPVEYEVIEHLAAGEVAAVLGLDPGQAFKTLVVLPERAGARPMLALIPGDSNLDLKKLAAASGEKKVQMAPHREAERLTGLEKGGISPLALMDKAWPVFIDETVILYDEIEVSAGKVGHGVIVDAAGLVRVVKAVVADIAAPA